MSTETKKRGARSFVLVVAFEMLLFLGSMITAIVFLVGGASYPSDPDKIRIGFILMYSAIGIIPLVLIPTVIVMVFRRRKTMFSSLQSFKLSKIGPYAPGYKSSGTKNPRFCEYCGYEVVYGERECPECSGPVKTINSTYI